MSIPTDFCHKRGFFFLFFFSAVFVKVCDGEYYISWESGDSTGAKAGSNTNPSGRYLSASWTLGQANSSVLYIFGGKGTGSIVTNDLWKYDGSWSLISGSTTSGAVGIYGTQGVPSSSNVPGARFASSSWTDSQGNLWLFGGESIGDMKWNDLWKWSNGQWTWVRGSNIPNNLTDDSPSARSYSSAWYNSKGLYLFGGILSDDTFSNELWRFSDNAWVLVSNSSASYGTQGGNSSTNWPTARHGSAFATDSAGNFWLFGGYGFDANSSQGGLNDLWKFDGTVWTWVSGSNYANVNPVYEKQGSYPGSRHASSAWFDSNDNFWLFGGEGLGFTGANVNSNSSVVEFSEIWSFKQTWSLVYGVTTGNAKGLYGQLHKTSRLNLIGARSGAVALSNSDKSEVWVFGGDGYDGNGVYGPLNDLWSLSTTAPQSLIPSFSPAISRNYTLPVILLVLTLFVVLLILSCIGYAALKNWRARRASMGPRETGEAVKKSENEVVQMDDIELK